MARQAPGQALRCAIVSDFADDQRVEADHGIVIQANVALRRVGLLIRPREAEQKAIEPLVATVEAVENMPTRQLLDPPTHGRSRTLGSRSSFSMRACERGGASSACVNRV